MGLFDNFGKKITQSSQDAVQKAKNFADVTKLNSQINDEKKAIVNFYKQVGEKYYSLYGTDPQEEFKQLCEFITAKNNKIAQLETEIRRIQNVNTCPKCGNVCSDTLLFCSSCGESLPKERSNKLICNECGTELSITAVFCTNCGKKV